MDPKKNVCSYIILASFGFFCGLSIFCLSEAAGLTKMFGWPQPVLIGGICIYLLLVAAVFAALRALFTEIGKHLKDKKRLDTVLAVIFPVLTILGIVVYLVFYLMYHIPITLHDDTFYRMALVMAEGGVNYSAHGATYLYVCLLHGMFFIFGNTPFAGIVLQIVLFFVCLFLLYIGMRDYAGVIPATAATALLGFFPLSIGYIFSLTSEFFYLALYLLGFCLTGIVYRKFTRSGKASLGEYVFLFLAGLYVGFLVYLDIHGISLYFFFVCLYFAGKEKRKQAFLANVLALLGGTGGFFLSTAAVFLAAGNLTGRGNFATDFSIFLKQYVSFYLENMNLSGNDILKAFSSYGDISFIAFLLLISLAFFVVPAVFLRKRRPVCAFVLNLFLLYGVSYWGLTGLQGQMRGIMYWCMLAGLGVWGTICLSDKLPAEKESEDIEMKDADNTVIIEKKTTEEAEVPEEKKTGEQKAESKGAEKKEQEKPAPGKPLHNPLPVPKRKSRPQADFAHQVAEADMKFDIETADDDDFDV